MNASCISTISAISGDFEAARQYAMRGVQIWRLGGVQSPVEEVMSPAVVCMCFGALSQWHLGQIASSQATLAEAISLAKEPNDMYALGHALWFAGFLGHYEHNPAEVERMASNVIELSTRQNFAHWLALGAILRGWAHSALGHTTDGIAQIEAGIEDYRGTGSIVDLPYLLSLKAEALHLAHHTVEALEVVREADTLVKRSGIHYWCAVLLYSWRKFRTATPSRGDRAS